MMSVMLIFQLFLNVVITNCLYSIHFTEFNNLCNSINESILFSSIPTIEVLDCEIVGINENEFESKITDFMETNIRSMKIKVSFYYYNEDCSSCYTNTCDSVQFKVEDIHSYFHLSKVFNYHIRVNL